MAALRACPSGLVFGPRRPYSRSRLRVVPLFSSTSLLSLKTTSTVGRTTAARLPNRNATRAQNGAFNWPSDLDPDNGKPIDTHFREEIETIGEYREKITSRDTDISHMNDRSLSFCLCLVVKRGVVLASAIMDSAIFNDKYNEISLHTTKQTVAMYVSIFVNLVEKTNHKRFNAESFFSLLGAFGGLAAVSHILLQDALASPDYHKDSLSSSSLINEIEIARSEFKQKMNTLEDRFREVSNSTEGYELIKLMKHTMFDAMTLTSFFVTKMLATRDMVLGVDSFAKRCQAWEEAWRQGFSDDGYW